MTPQSSQSCYHIYTERIDGTELLDQLSLSPPLPLERVRELTIQLIDALTHVHAQGVAHRDVKLENVTLHP